MQDDDTQDARPPCTCYGRTVCAPCRAFAQARRVMGADKVAYRRAYRQAHRAEAAADARAWRARQAPRLRPGETVEDRMRAFWATQQRAAAGTEGQEG